MVRYLCRKALILFLSLFCVISGTFVLMKTIPGNPFLDEHITEEVLKTLLSYYGLDKPLWQQYLIYLKGFAVFDFGHSLVYHGRSVRQLIADSFPFRPSWASRRSRSQSPAESCSAHGRPCGDRNGKTRRQ